MNVIFCDGYGSTDVLRLIKQEMPKPTSDQVLIDVKAASVNPVDWKIRSGQLKIKTGLKPPKVLGSDFAGVVTVIGSQVSGYAVGDHVWGKFDSFKGGAYAQAVLAEANNISLMPGNIDFLEAAAFPNVALTAYQAMVRKAGLEQGQNVMVNGASGGVGMMAVQIAKTMNCHVTAVCSAKNVDSVKSLGADVVLDYNTDDILASKNTYDVFFDCVSNQSFFKVKGTLKRGGVHIKTTPDLMSIVGVLLNCFGIKRPDHIMVKPSHQDLLQFKNWVERDQLKIIVENVFPLTAIDQAHNLSESGRVVGKLVLDTLK